VVEDETGRDITSDTWSFETEFIPNKPELVYPESGAEAVELGEENMDTELIVNVRHPEGELMNVTFYNETDDWEIGNVTEVEDGEVSVTWEDLEFGTYYEWYVNVSEYGNEHYTISETWNFTTEDIVVELIEPEHGAEVPFRGDEDPEVELRVDVTHPHAKDMNVTFFNATDDQIGDNVTIEGDGIANVTWEDLDFDTTYEWYVEVVDEDDYSVFAPEDYENEPWNFTVVEGENYTLTVEESVGEGTVYVDGDEVELPYEEEYFQGTEVELEAVPDEGYRFSHWEGDVHEDYEEDAEITITMDADKTLTANFEEIPTYELTINAEEGGTTDPAPDTYTYEEGEEVTVEAIPDDGYVFDEWTGDYTGTDAEITFVIEEDMEITAWFEEEVVVEEYDLTINIEGQGTTDPAEGTHTYEEGTEVTVEATPDEGWEFVEWTGDVTDTDPTITVTMDEDKEITAWFEEEPEPDEAYFEVEITAYDDEVEEGDTVTVEFEVENTGELEGTQDIVFSVDGTEEDSVEVTLDAGDTYSGEFTWEAGEPGDYDLEVASDDTSDSVTVTVEEEPGLIERLIPGFTTILLMISVIIAVAIYYKKEQ